MARCPGGAFVAAWMGVVGNRGEEGDWRGGGSLPPALSCSSYHSMLRDLGRKADSSAEAYSAFLLFSCFCLTDKRWANLERLLSDLGKGRGKALMSLQHPGAWGHPMLGAVRGTGGLWEGQQHRDGAARAWGKPAGASRSCRNTGCFCFLQHEDGRASGEGSEAGRTGRLLPAPALPHVPAALGGSSTIPAGSTAPAEPPGMARARKKTLLLLLCSRERPSGHHPLPPGTADHRAPSEPVFRLPGVPTGFSRTKYLLKCNKMKRRYFSEMRAPRLSSQ